MRVPVNWTWGLRTDVNGYDDVAGSEGLLLVLGSEGLGAHDWRCVDRTRGRGLVRGTGYLEIVVAAGGLGRCSER